jgi:hypothetical protein
MADGIIRKDLKGGYIVARFVASGFLKTNHVTATIGANSAGETVQSMQISSMVCSTSNGAYFTVARGANVVAVMSGSPPVQDYQGHGFYLDSATGEPTSNVVITKVGLGPTWITLKLHKRVAISGGSQY